MSLNNLNKFYGKLDQLRALLSFGQQAMPFIEELFDFIREVAPLMEDINQSLRTSTGKIPSATSQIRSVSQATELATTEILDLVDDVQGKLDVLEQRLKCSAEHVARVRAVDDRLVALLRRELGEARPELLAEVEALVEEKRRLSDATDAEVEGERQVLGELRSQAGRIMMALQVQDITSQQLAAVMHLIESIRVHLGHLVRRLEEEPWEEGEAEMPVDPGTFNPDAVYDPSGRLQEAADAVAGAYQRGEPVPDVEAPAPPAADASSGAAAAAEKGAAASQDDIDALFSNGAPAPEPEEPDEPASQDDIDALFAGGL